MSKKSILKGTLEVGGVTLVSRALGIIRELLQIRFLGAGALADAFLTAWKIPYSLRKIFAEGLADLFPPLFPKQGSYCI
jgi:putative peptidoglycan lipid II flippase